MDTTEPSPSNPALGARESRGRKSRDLLARLDRSILALPASLRGVLVVALVPIVGCLDFLTGAELSFSIFYLVPVILSARYQKGSTAYVCAVFAGTVWLAAELLSQSQFSHPLIPYWNAIGRTVFFFVAVGFMRVIGRRDARLEAEVKRQTTAMQRLISSRRTLEREMAEATAREHARLAVELHDGVGQYLAGLSYQARALAEDLESDGSVRTPQAARLVEMLRLTNRLLRRIDHLLVPPIADSGGLNVAFRRLASDIEQFTGVKCEVELPLEPVVIGEFQALTLFRIGQEALNNAIKHGEGRSVCLRFRVVDTGLSLVVSDEGRGFAMPDDWSASGGLRIMRHRAELIGATLGIHSREGEGCVVDCVLPWRGAKAVQTHADNR